MKQRLKKYCLFITIVLILICFSGSAVYANGQHTVAVNENTRIDVQITDQNGHSVAPGQPIDDISYIIKTKPEGAKVSVYTADKSQLENAGKLTMAFNCDKPGTVEVQTFIRLKDAAKYYTGLHTIQVVDQPKQNGKIVIMSIGSSQIIVNNDVVHADAAPVIKEDRTYVPLRALSQIFDAVCSYDQTQQQVTITKGDTVIVTKIGDNTYTINGTEKPLDAEIYAVNGRTMVPIRFIAEAFGAVVKPTYDESGTVADILFQI